MWEAEYWLPQNVSWSDIPSKAEDLTYPIFFAIPILLMRILYEAFVGVTLRWLIGYRDRPLQQQIKQHLFFGFARDTRYKRVLECFFRFTFYTFLWLYGIYVLWGAPWLTDVKQCWIGYPGHPVPNTVWWYYMVETGFYYSLLVTSVFDAKRSDYIQLVFHHFVTIGLLSASWAINFVRVGTLILISHDVSDVTLEFAKLVRYNTDGIKYSNWCFVVFVSSWILTRIGYFPFVIIRSALFEAAGLIQADYSLTNIFQKPYAPRAIILLLICLFALHLFWTRLIVAIVWRTMKSGEAKDVRSGDEAESEDGVSERIKKTNNLKKRPKRQ